MLAEGKALVPGVPLSMTQFGNHTAAPGDWEGLHLYHFSFSVEFSPINRYIPLVYDSIITEYRDGVMLCPTSPEQCKTI